MKIALFFILLILFSEKSETAEPTNTNLIEDSLSKERQWRNVVSENRAKCDTWTGHHDKQAIW